MKTVFISGGGTGGHYYPALSVAQALKEKGYKVIYVGTDKGIEAKKGFAYADEVILLRMEAVRGRGLFGKVKGIYSLLKTTFKVKKLIKKEKPDFSICFGGYTSFPLGFASFLTKTPLYIHEQNSIPSYTNRLLSFFAKKIFITFHYTKKFFNPKKTFLTGMPLRKAIIEEAKNYIYTPTDKKTVLVVGGSQGSKKLSEITVNLAKTLPEIEFILIKGKWEVELPKLNNLTVYDYYENMQELYKKADLIVSRSGSGTVNEILAFGKYAIFIPYPYAASNHQFYNVKWLYDLGLCEIIEEKDLTQDTLKEKIKQSLNNDLLKLHQEIKKHSILSATEKIIEYIYRN
ncbi:undecaprenyldiphospho-muramoylpentapeptide beta-N-acetylglucosaminyltransferase [Sulfurihydrogenibium subterraneum]|uniref:undecaprenyldiphospho-muramoylpentapeptide beta-N-acetylglucosaminyltransferase n=1 Tax=Sulfurihydrogenibium subterraneum TaxID=171121 RepID=UPI0004910DE3|nr:undecaprenyldiphospho-muramoylpentapeptide beta-N-acetylglucosaminyltransferase [Sulfurihydrogenibium subterraneum]